MLIFRWSCLILSRKTIRYPGPHHRISKCFSIRPYCLWRTLSTGCFRPAETRSYSNKMGRKWQTRSRTVSRLHYLQWSRTLMELFWWRSHMSNWHSLQEYLCITTSLQTGHSLTHGCFRLSISSSWVCLPSKLSKYHRLDVSSTFITKLWSLRTRKSWTLPRANSTKWQGST
jgi:hypothetical protein